ncbi:MULTISPECIES: tRNA (guanosine(46)-N7)-methyltransferase TrmB [Globicatella]|uniref:tRNA (guanine-N(7)-)-methyltransferase n=1 Tax=Globicatella sulfidifaciens TaxID=136093 RepID=A0A7X8C390_9LACT|nr:MULTISPECIES: tRNA (guanosine(46)-N7)-methyltransferase TrmB [Globicatella]MDK7630404.1 tRNA (guanosine(46)-N7)-methyltransferase TrmB [Globicatella sanguinis]NLJ17989.1 tRNA (guanosine(46)-N7)-methyltransferase TrmB [Globicatella sulfidifaciens]WIK66287.1 tRNA (guanosine(46)-N7)-methyltransferase TrmB [Globicatella sanguinis]WKT55692.1 tRNA (guanosine(46)-N7)-methyltransferase TrmB [Globicatella sanguinis]
MRLRNKPWAQDKLDAHPEYVPQEAEQFRGKWQTRFEKVQPLHIEVGSGKGRFIVEMAKAHPEINYISIEIQTSVIVSVLELQLEAQLPNLQILHADGRNLNQYFEPGEVSRIYLNFSDPWPKKRHEKRRLTSADFIKQYEEILVADGEIHFKTDNQGLFEYTLYSFSQYGIKLKQVWLDLHHSDFEGNIMTEYEEKFSSKGNRIYRLEAYFDNEETKSK